MLEILAITAPIFLLIGLGYAAVRGGYFAAVSLAALGQFVLRLALPALLFRAVSQRTLAEVFEPRFLAAFLIGSLVAMLAGLAVARWGRGMNLEAAALVGMGSGCANSSFVGLPVALQVVGPAATIAFAQAVIVENLVMLPLVLALADSGSARHEPFLKAFTRALAGLPRNPLVLALVGGLVCALFEWRLPAPFARAVDLLAAATAAVALFFNGGSLVGLHVQRAMALDLSIVALGKLVVHPLAVFLALQAIGGVAPALQASAVLLACAPMMSIYPVIGQRHGLQAFCAANLLAATVVSFVTIALAIAALHNLRLVA